MMACVGDHAIFAWLSTLPRRVDSAGVATSRKGLHRMHSHRIPAFLFLVILFLVALPAVAQFAPNGYSDEPGIPASTTAFNVENGFINLSDGNLHLEIPIGSYPQRGSMKSLRSRLVYDSRFWTFDPNTDDRPSGWQPNGVNIGPMYIASGWRLIAEGQV